MTLEMPKLKYDTDALEPHISRETLKYHYGKHTKKYFETANELIKGTAYEGKALDELINKDTMTKMGSKLFNNVCQAYNHSFYFDCLSPSEERGEPSAELKEALLDDFASFGDFQDKFLETSVNGFGSTWTWLVLNKNKLQIKSMPNAGCPLTTEGCIPLLVCDLWEHSWYLDYPADKKSYTTAFWNVLNWNFVNDNFAAANKDT